MNNSNHELNLVDFKKELFDKDIRVRIKSIEGIEKFSKESIIDLLVEILKDKSENKALRMKIAESFEKFKDTDFFSVASDILEDKNEDVILRCNLVKSLGIAESDEVTDVFYNILKDKSESDIIRFEVANAYLPTDQQGVKLLISILENINENKKIRLEIINTLKKVALKRFDKTDFVEVFFKNIE